MPLKIIITGATGMVGEGVLLECLENAAIEKVLMVNRKPFKLAHAKLTELIVPDFLNADAFGEQLKGYDACFFCAGVSAIGLNEEKYTRITYDTTTAFAKTLASLNPNMVFTYVSGKSTDSSEKGRMMWARVKGKTENALQQLPFKAVYNFRPGMLKPTQDQQNIKSFFKIITPLYPFIRAVAPNSASTLKELAVAMIKCAKDGYEKKILEVSDINLLGKG